MLENECWTIYCLKSQNVDIGVGLKNVTQVKTQMMVT